MKKKKRVNNNIDFDNDKNNISEAKTDVDSVQKTERVILNFKLVKTDQEILEVLDHNVDAFVDPPDFKWSLEDIKREIQLGWNVFGVYYEREVMAAVLYMVEGDSLLTKNTAIKMQFQGSGHSHQIKEFFEESAKNSKLKNIYHYCRIDNFRAYSLNESHGYKKTGKTLGNDGQVVEWHKRVSYT